MIDETLSDAEALGVKGLPEPKQDYFEVIPEIWLAVNIFTDISTQWRSDNGHLIGLDYNALAWIFELKKDNIKKPKELFADIQVIEVKIIEIVNKKNK